MRRLAVGAVFAVAVIAVLFAVSQGGPAQPLPGQPLRALGNAKGVVIGTAVREDVERKNRAYRELIAAQFQSVTAENEMKWYVLQPEAGTFEFDTADRLVKLAREAGQAVRGHALVFHNQLPLWVGKLGPRGLRRAMRAHIEEVMRHYAGQVSVWDVVNEALLDDGRFRRSPFLDKLGPSYIGEAFRLARRANPKARLYINEIGAEGINDKSNRLYELVRDLKARGAPIDGVGFQTHFNLDGVPAGFLENLRRFEALGVEVAITEADVGLPVPPSAQQLEAQAVVYRQIVETCLSVKACKSLTFWGFTDGRSWIPETQPGMGAATLLDEALKPKPAFGAVQRALGGAAA